MGSLLVWYVLRVWTHVRLTMTVSARAGCPKNAPGLCLFSLPQPHAGSDLLAFVLEPDPRPGGGSPTQVCRKDPFRHRAGEGNGLERTWGSWRALGGSLEFEPAHLLSHEETEGDVGVSFQLGCEMGCEFPVDIVGWGPVTEEA